MNNGVGVSSFCVNTSIFNTSKKFYITSFIHGESVLARVAMLSEQLFGCCQSSSDFINLKRTTYCVLVNV